MKLLDTNILMYAAGKSHAYKDSCLSILRRVVDGSKEFVIDAELLQEILYVYNSRRERQRGLQSVDEILAFFPSPLPIGRPEVVEARSLMAAYPHLLPRDAFHAGVVVANGLEGIVSADRGFDGVAEITRFDPTSV